MLMRRQLPTEWFCPLCKNRVDVPRGEPRHKVDHVSKKHFPLTVEQEQVLVRDGLHVVVCELCAAKHYVTKHGATKHFNTEKKKKASAEAKSANSAEPDQNPAADLHRSSSDTRSDSPVVDSEWEISGSGSARASATARGSREAKRSAARSTEDSEPRRSQNPRTSPSPISPASVPVVPAPAPAVAGADHAGHDTITPEMLLNQGRLKDNVPQWARPMFTGITDRLLDLALQAKTNGDQPTFERRIVHFFAATASLLKPAGSGGRKRGERRLRVRLNRLAAELERAFDEPADVVLFPEVSDEKSLPEAVRVDQDVDQRVTNTVKRLLRDGFASRAAKALLQTGTASHTPEIAQKLKEKIPQQEPEAMPPLPTNAPKTIIQPDTKLRNFVDHFAAKGAAPGPFQISGRVLSLIVESDVGLRALAAIMTDLANGEFTAAMLPWFNGSIGIALPKGDGDVRPVCIGDVFARLTASWLVQASIDSIRTACGPEQQGQGVKSGCESIVHVLQACLEDPSKKLACLKIDIKNAFNTRSRAHCLTSLFRHQSLSSLWRMARWAYEGTSPVWFLSHGSVVDTIRFCIGVKQGDPLGSVLFDLSIAEMLQATSQVDPSIQVLADHDDVFLIGEAPKFQKVFEFFQGNASCHGSVVAKSKCELLYFHQEAAPLPVAVREWIQADAIRLQTKAAVVLGAPIGRDVQAVSALAVKAATDHQLFFDRLCSQNLPTQHALLLLRICGVPRWNYLVRCVRPAAMLEANALFEKMQFGVFRTRTKIAEAELTDRHIDEISLPVAKCGGWGLRRPSKVSPFAWFAAQAAAAPLLEKFLCFFDIEPIADAGIAAERKERDGKDEKEPDHDRQEPTTARFLSTKAALNHIHASCVRSRALSAVLPSNAVDCLSFYVKKVNRLEGEGEAEDDHDGENGKRQKEKPLQHLLSKAAEAQVFQRLKDHGTPEEKRYLAARCVPEAHHWKLAIPSRWQLELDNETIEMCARIELGLTPLQKEKLDGNCGLCQKDLALDPVHFISCLRTRREIFRRHSEVIQLIALFCRLAGVHVTIEPNHLKKEDNQRPDLDLLVRLSSCPC